MAGVLLLASAVPFLRSAPQEPMSQPKPDPIGKPPVATVRDSDANGMLLIDSLESCRITVDERPQGVIEPGAVRILALSPGKHVVSGVAVKGGAFVKQPVQIKPHGQAAVLLNFSGAGETPYRTNSHDGQEYAWISADNFAMGCASADGDCAAEELPAHRIAITHGFWMGRTEVMQDAYQRFCESQPGACPASASIPASSNQLPQANVSWDEAGAFCHWAGGRLPTEAEWEYAARGGLPELRFPSANTISHEDANYSGKEGRDQWSYSSPVGSFPSNDYGLFDMAGNLWEWCADWYSASYYGSSPSTDPPGPIRGTARVVRGGSWNNLVARLRVSSRDALEPGTRLPTVGFRCVRKSVP